MSLVIHKHVALLTLSGVDATVPDQSSYMSHVFGLRSVSSAEHPNKEPTLGLPRSRIVSDPTFVRAAASGLPEYQHANHSTSARDLPRAKVVRDYNQVIGIKNSHVEVPVEAQVSSAYSEAWTFSDRSPVPSPLATFALSSV